MSDRIARRSKVKRCVNQRCLKSIQYFASNYFFYKSDEIKGTKQDLTYECALHSKLGGQLLDTLSLISSPHQRVPVPYLQLDCCSKLLQAVRATLFKRQLYTGNLWAIHLIVSFSVSFLEAGVGRKLRQRPSKS